MFKRILLFLALNFLIITTLSLILTLLGIDHYLTNTGLDYTSLLIVCFIWGMGGALISLALSRFMAKKLMGVKIIDPKSASPQELFLFNMVHSLARKADLEHMPEVGLFFSKDPNAFATGPSKKRSLVAVSTALLEKMNENELKGVIGHEISHIVNGDMVTMTLLQGVVNAFVMFLARVLAYALSGLGKSRDNSARSSHLSFVAFTYLFEIVFMILGSLLVFAYSRYREFRADAGGAEIAGKDNMIQALEKLKKSLQPSMEEKEASPMAAFKISRPTKKGFFRFFASHPPLEERIERLRSE